MVERRVTQLILEAEVDGDSQREITQLILEIDVGAPSVRQITQVFLEVEILDPYNPPVDPVMPGDLPWSPALYAQLGEGPLNVSFYGIHANVISLGNRRQWQTRVRR